MRRYTNSHSCAGHSHNRLGSSTHSHHSRSSANRNEGRRSSYSHDRLSRSNGYDSFHRLNSRR